MRGITMRVRLKIKEVAQRQNMSQYRLAKVSGVDGNRIRTLYRNPYTIVTTETLGKLATALNVDASELIENVPDNE
jgi:DNA-binding Xre family transcriptional regulator